MTMPSPQPSPTPRDDAALLEADRAIAAAPLPTPRTIRARQNLLIQLGRFVVLNTRIMRMVLKGDH
ncbi:MAG: hypothetical protein IPJ14_01970 [Kineosporiaceae bacterium]|nr:hypothetical protein [Kineosporiaceae bacterium]MBK7621453.1 hypothetical protein [Kineosporiaceae bacterium]MBK8077389.1 hypothetical protein [Kineosporiaceae bacterium]